jgi:hypothetical protein
MVNWIFLIVSVALADKVSWLMNTVGPGFWAVIVMVVSSAWVAAAKRSPKVKREATTVRQRVFIVWYD